MKKIIVTLWCLSLVAFADISVQSQKKQSVMVELFSSQGCSSCPPAEEWLNSFIDNPDLWTKYVPLSFHVNYWDQLGWKDPFATVEFTQRQYAYKKQGYTSGVYTPGFLINSKEWRGWFDKSKSDITLSKASVLLLSSKNSLIFVNYNTSGQFEAHVALLGFGLETEVLKGENKGKTLEHDFVVLDMQSVRMKGSKAEFKAFEIGLRLNDMP